MRPRIIIPRILMMLTGRLNKTIALSELAEIKLILFVLFFIK